MGLRRIFKNLKRANRKKEEYLNISYSQEGEDLVLGRIFDNKNSGFFVDVGALHPQRYSNTYKFYLSGWRGINIDAMPGSMALFNTVRPLDINLEMPVSDTSDVLEYHIFKEPALNTFSKEIAEEYSKDCVIEKTIKVRTNTLAAILDEYLPEGQEIDFLTIDVEGLDFQVLKSNNWEKYRPKIVLIESFLTLSQMTGSAQDRFLQSKGYQLCAKTVNTYFYTLEETS